MRDAEIIAAYAAAHDKRTDEQKRLIREYRAQFVKGRKFRVLVPTKFWGMQPMAGGGQRGWSQVMQPGTVLTCAGQSMTWGSDGVPALKWLDADGKFIANDCMPVDVVGGMWGGQLPRPGLLEEVK